MSSFFPPVDPAALSPFPPFCSPQAPAFPYPLPSAEALPLSGGSKRPKFLSCIFLMKLCPPKSPMTSSLAKCSGLYILFPLSQRWHLLFSFGVARILAGVIGGGGKMFKSHLAPSPVDTFKDQTRSVCKQMKLKSDHCSFVHKLRSP